MDGKQPIKTVWKYKLERKDGVQKVRMPMRWDVIRVAWLDGHPTMWALVEPEEPESTKYFMVYGTGQVLDDEWAHIYEGTCFEKIGEHTFVWHVFHVMPLIEIRR